MNTEGPHLRQCVFWDHKKEITLFEDFGTILCKDKKIMRIFLSLNQNCVRVKSMPGEIMLAENPLYIHYFSYLTYSIYHSNSKVMCVRVWPRVSFD